ncbi:hypothetical protein, partial [Stenotrophomonas maltophilia]|uniref:hypothetical protein n=1 Tax=Stenotrophomonas maltophilia TaxID=40324 RepID=UPI0019392A7D
MRPATEKKKENQSQNQTLVALLLVAAQVATHPFVVIHTGIEIHRPSPGNCQGWGGVGRQDR